jgi:hypothetical protein
MRRRFFNLAAAVSLVMCVATVVFWYRSRRTNDTVVYSISALEPTIIEPLCHSESARITIGVQWYDPNQFDAVFFRPMVDGEPSAPWAYTRSSNPEAAGKFVRPRPAEFTGVEFLGAEVAFRKWNPRSKRHDTAVILPWWMLAVLTGGLPGCWAVQRFRQRLRCDRATASPPCPTCGYDLRATPDRCPECGTTTAPPITARARA